MNRWHRLLLVSTLGCALSARAQPPLVNSNDAVSAATEANGGGCYPVSISPSLLDMIVLLNPEWAALDVDTHTPRFPIPLPFMGPPIFPRSTRAAISPPITLRTTRTHTSSPIQRTPASWRRATSGRWVRRAGTSSSNRKSAPTRFSHGRVAGIASLVSGAGSGTVATQMPIPQGPARRLRAKRASSTATVGLQSARAAWEERHAQG